jgi:hypothetical protein
MPLSATDQQYIDSLVEEIDSFLRRYEEKQRRDEERRRDEDKKQRRDEERRRDEDKRFWNEEVRPVLRARLSPAEQRVLVELLALLDRS